MSLLAATCCLFLDTKTLILQNFLLQKVSDNSIRYIYSICQLSIYPFHFWNWRWLCVIRKLSDIWLLVDIWLGQRGNMCIDYTQYLNFLHGSNSKSRKLQHNSRIMNNEWIMEWKESFLTSVYIYSVVYILTFSAQ